VPSVVTSVLDLRPWVLARCAPSPSPQSLHFSRWVCAPTHAPTVRRLGPARACRHAPYLACVESTQPHGRAASCGRITRGRDFFQGLGDDLEELLREAIRPAPSVPQLSSLLRDRPAGTRRRGAGGRCPHGRLLPHPAVHRRARIIGRGRKAAACSRGRRPGRGPPWPAGSPSPGPRRGPRRRRPVRYAGGPQTEGLGPHGAAGEGFKGFRAHQLRGGVRHDDHTPAPA